VGINKSQQLIRRGSYAIVRHPIYASILLALFGTTLVSATVSSLLGFVLTVVALCQKGRIEESFLIVEFGQQYIEYQREVKFSIPFIC
jgi:protein-S-isoprenylcysteine O-methyltransferase Ste14